MQIIPALTALSALLGDRLARSLAQLEQHASSETHIHSGLPDAVAYPATTAEVAEIMTLCAQHRVPVIGWGAGTSLEGHALPLHGGITVDFSHMNKVLAINAGDMTARVQPGITRERLNEDLRDTGLFFPVDPGANATLGGMAATRASGTTAVRYGTMRDAVLGLEVVMADGRIIRTGTAARKSASGYDLTALFVGSEGTLGLITELTLCLQGQPEAISAAVCAFPDIAAAVDCVIATIQSGLAMARIEFLDAAAVAACNAYSKTTLPLAPHLLVEFHGSPTFVAEQAARFGEITNDYKSLSFQWAKTPEDRARLWKMRHAAYPACLALRPGATAIVTDICVPISKLAQAVTETQADIAASPIPGPILGHVGDGNFHAILLINPANPSDFSHAKHLASRMAERALRLGGTVTGEHGIGMGKLEYMEQEHGLGWDVMGQIKHVLDPLSILNPGKLVRQP